MPRLRYLVMFFWMVAPVPRLMVLAFAVVTAAGAVSLVSQPEGAARVLMPLLLLQLFAASSGFAVPARRGHFDFVLTMGESRWRIAAAHWVVSILPGVGGWAVMACVEAAATRGSEISLLSSGSVAAVAITSTVPWALAVSLPRFAVAIGWLLALAIVNMTAAGQRMLSQQPAGDVDSSWYETAIAVLLYPPRMAGESIRAPEAFAVVPVLIVAFVVMAAALFSIDRRDIPLEAAQ